jgi:hypothetical protein
MVTTADRKAILAKLAVWEAQLRLLEPHEGDVCIKTEGVYYVVQKYQELNGRRQWVSISVPSTDRGAADSIAAKAATKQERIIPDV